MNIFVANIDRKVSEETLLDLFQEHGEVSSLKLIKDRDTGVSKGYAFVEMANNDEAQKAIDALNEVELEGRALAVNEARPKTEYKKGAGAGYNKEADLRSWEHMKVFFQEIFSKNSK